ncbi:maleylpyruvate isomerase family mycothiol-dependent enzyme [Kribbella sp. NPDC051952]|uniref:maleylpyruvate isomerase family mycothiol-dependent enzyme n=1 Tax=Kribbella sp. NPDC051952 TaxID=3154851 RepID=UPI003447A923
MRSQEWIAEGTALCRSALADLAGPSLLPDWTRKHLAAHLALNAEGIGNLVQWAKTGEEHRMYLSPEQRTVDIEAGALRPDSELITWFDQSARLLADQMAGLTDDQWARTVRTMQGMEVPATYTPWMRSREVMIHAVDLGAGVTFADLPTDFLEALCADIRTMRGDVPELDGPLPEVAAYLAGRSYDGVFTADGSPAEPLPPWL